MRLRHATGDTRTVTDELTPFADKPQRHAPRGRIKADPSADLPIRPRCTAHSSRTGQPCKQYPIAGATVCRTHGGAAPQVQAKAEERLKALQPLAIRRLEELAGQAQFPSVAYQAVRDILDRTIGEPVKSVQLSGQGGGDIVIRVEQPE